MVLRFRTREEPWLHPRPRRGFYRVLNQREYAASMLFYLLHIPTIHLAAVVVSRIREGAVNSWLFGNHPLAPPPLPLGYRWSLSLLYLVFAVVIALLYLPCRWYAAARSRDRTGLLRYL